MNLEDEFILEMLEEESENSEYGETIRKMLKNYIHYKKEQNNVSKSNKNKS